MLRSKKGFTLLEMMVVTGVVVIISGVGIATVADTIQKTKNSQAEYQQHTSNFDNAQLGVHGILVERNGNLPAQSYTPIPQTGGDEKTNNGNNGNHNGNGGNNGNVDNNGNHNGNEQGVGNQGVLPNNNNTNPNINTNPDNGSGDKDVNDNGGSNNNTDPAGGNGNGNGHGNGNGWGVGTDNGHGQPDVKGSVSLKANSQYDLQANTTIKSTGNRGIETLIITVPNGVTLNGVGDAGNGGRYDVKVEGNTITIQVKHESWVTPATSLNVNNISWSGAQNIDISYQIIYAK